MSDSWDKARVLQAEAEKVRAEVELLRATPENQKAYAESANASHRARMVGLAGRATKGVITVIGRAAVVHSIWAATVVAVTWILVVYGWRG